MDKKLIIQLVVIVSAFGGAAIILYNSFFKNSISPPPNFLAGIPAAQKSQDDILPNGRSLNFKVIDENRFEYNVIQYPQVDAKREVGIPPDELINPLAGQ